MAAVPCSYGLAAVSSPWLFKRAVQAANTAEKEVAIGIDLGTKNSVVGVLQGDSVEVIKTDGAPTMPSVVSYSPDGERHVGKPAVARLQKDPSNTIYDVKRLIGRTYNERGIADSKKILPYEVAKGTASRAVIQLPNGTIIQPEEASAAILSKLKSSAEAHLKRPVTKAVVTVPAYFNDAQRASTKAAAEIAGLKVLRVINEPTAAAVAHGYGEPTSSTAQRKNVLVFDIGGGTFDVSLLAVEGGVLEVLATAGDTRLGGQDIDVALMQHVMKDFKKHHSIDLTNNKSAIERLRKSCIAAKHDLSTSLMSKVPSPLGDPNHVKGLTRKELESIAKPVLQKCLPPVTRVLKDAKVKKSHVSDILLVGGVTRMPAVRDMVTKYFGRKVLSTKEVDPDLAVATGAAIQAAKLSGVGGKTNSILLLDVAPLTTGIETEGGYMTPVIERNTPIPARQSKLFTTTKDAQSAVDIRVHQGERPKAKDNFLLGEFSLKGIPPVKKGVPKVKVTFDVDANGILKVTAEDQATKKKSDITIHSNSTLTQDDIKRMVADSQKHSEADKKVTQARSLRDDLTTLMERAKTSAQAVPKKEGSAISTAVSSVESWLQSPAASTDTDSTLSTLASKKKWLEDKLNQTLQSVYKN